MPPRRTKPASATRQLAGFIAKFDPTIARVVRTARAALRRRFPTAIELVYDNYNALAIGFATSERTSDVFVSLAVYPRVVNLYFMYGARLPDLRRILQGSGTQGRFVPLRSAADLDAGPIRALIDAAVAHGKVPLPAAGRGHTEVRAVSRRQRPRRPPSPKRGRATRGRT